MRVRRVEWLMIGIVLLTFALGAIVYPRMPERVASHWNERGEVNGYMTRVWGVFLVPAMSAGLLVLLLLVPKIDPYKANIAAFRRTYDAFLVGFLVFMLYIYALTLVWNMGTRFNMLRWMAPAMGAVFFVAGVLLTHAKRNWFIGIRTPWTLMSENVWDKTHRLGSVLFKAAGILAALGVFFPQAGIWLILVPVLAVALFTVVYSYVEYQKEKTGAE